MRTSFFFDVVFLNPTDVKKFMFVKDLIFAGSRYRFCLNKTGTKLLGEVDVHLSPHLHNNNKSFLKSTTETGEVAFDLNALSYMRRKLKDPTYTISIIYGFPAEKEFHSFYVRFKDFVLPNLKIEVKLKYQLLPDLLKKNV